MIRARDDRRLGPQRGGDEPAAAEPLQPVAVLEPLAQPLVALREHGGQLAGGQQPVRVGGAGHGVPGLAGRLAHHRQVEHHVGGQQPQVPVGGVLVVHGHRQHQPVERQHPGVIGHHQRGALGRQVLDAAHLDPEPGPEEYPQQGPHDRAVEMRVKAELVDAVVTGEALTQEPGDRGDPLRQLVERRLRRRRASRAAVIIDLADHRGDLLGGCAAAGIGQQRRMLAS